MTATEPLLIPMRDSDGFLRALAVRQGGAWIEVIQALDGQPLVIWTAAMAWPADTPLVVNDAGEVMTVVQIAQLAHRVLAYLLPCDRDRQPQLSLAAIVDSDSEVRSTFDDPGSGVRSLPIRDVRDAVIVAAG